MPSLEKVQSPPSPLPTEKRDSLLVVTWDILAGTVGDVSRGVFALPHGAGRLVGLRAHVSNFSGGLVTLTARLGLFTDNPPAANPVTVPAAADMYAQLMEPLTLGPFAATDQTILTATDLGNRHIYTREVTPQPLGDIYAAVEISGTVAAFADFRLELVILPSNWLPPSVSSPES